MKDPIRVAITGAAGNIGYALAFRIAAGDMLGEDQPVILQLIEIPPAMDALKGVVMELNDCAFPLLAGCDPRPSDLSVGFERHWLSHCWSARARAARGWSART